MGQRNEGRSGVAKVNTRDGKRGFSRRMLWFTTPARQDAYCIRLNDELIDCCTLGDRGCD